jgi:SAM-dependent methyltransferase
MIKTSETAPGAFYNNAEDFHVKLGNDFQIKELFKHIADLGYQFFGDRTKEISFLDIGCASGELPFVMQSLLGIKGAVFGVDISDSLIKNAQERFKGSGINFAVGDAQNFDLGRQFDFVTMTSVINAFEDPAPALDAMLKHTKPDGLAIITSMFNYHDLEVEFRYRRKENGQWARWDYLYPLARFVKLIEHRGWGVRVHEHVMPFDIFPKENPMRSWTTILNGVRHMTNQTRVVYNINVVQISKKLI